MECRLGENQNQIEHVFFKVKHVQFSFAMVMFNIFLQWRGDFTSGYHILGKYLDVEGFEG